MVGFWREWLRLAPSHVANTWLGRVHLLTNLAKSEIQVFADDEGLVVDENRCSIIGRTPSVRQSDVWRTLSELECMKVATNGFRIVMVGG